MSFSLRLVCLVLVSIIVGVVARPSVFPMPSVSVVENGSGLNPISDVSVVGGSSGPIPVPVISVSNSSKEGIDIANRINHLFKNLDPEINEPGQPERTISTNLNRISEDPESGSSQLKLNLNLDVEVQNGKPSRLALPHGELVVMFLPKRGGQNQPGDQPGFIPEILGSDAKGTQGWEGMEIWDSSGKLKRGQSGFNPEILRVHNKT